MKNNYFMQEREMNLENNVSYQRHMQLVNARKPQRKYAPSAPVRSRVKPLTAREIQYSRDAYTMRIRGNYQAARAFLWILIILFTGGIGFLFLPRDDSPLDM
jgi:hypothetical protein